MGYNWFLKYKVTVNYRWCFFMSQRHSLWLIKFHLSICVVMMCKCEMTPKILHTHTNAHRAAALSPHRIPYPLPFLWYAPNLSLAKLSSGFGLSPYLLKSNISVGGDWEAWCPSDDVVPGDTVPTILLKLSPKPHPQSHHTHKHACTHWSLPSNPIKQWVRHLIL